MNLLPQNIITDNTSLLLSFAKGGKLDTALHVREMTWAKLKDRLSRVDVGEKDGSYFVRGGDLINPARSDDNLRTADVVVLDGDSRLDQETGEIIVGAPPLHMVAEALTDMGVAFVAHTSHSHRPNELHKYRVVLPAKTASVVELSAVVEYLIDQLHLRGVMLADVRENHRWSQPWYLPRASSMKAFTSMSSDGGSIDPKAAMVWRDERHANERAIAAKISEPVQATTTTSDFKAFNDAHGIDYVKSILERNGYRFGYFDKSHNAYRYMRPGSTSKSYGVVVFKGSQGHWCTYSHHGGEDRLSGKVCDPFDLTAELQFGGDTSKATRTLLARPEYEQSIAEKIANKVAQSAVAAYLEADATLVPPQVKKRVELIQWGALTDVPIRWLVKDILPAQSLFALYGQPGAYKSFVALYLGAMVASGRDAFERPSKQGCVVYIAAEGGAGLKRRRDALVKQYGIDADIPMYFVKAQLNLGTSEQDISELIEEITSLRQNVALIVVDTLARSAGGLEENSSTEMSKLVENINTIMSALDCSVMLVHHAGKDSGRGLRGSSALLGAVDTSMECEKLTRDDDENRFGRFSVKKQKDGEDDLSFGYRLDKVQLSAIDPDATSLVVIPVDAAAIPARAGARGDDTNGKKREVMDALLLALKECGKPYVMNDRAPAGCRAVHGDTWRDYHRAMAPTEPAATKKNFYAWRKKLVETGEVGHWSDSYWLSYPEPVAKKTVELTGPAPGEMYDPEKHDAPF